jgi:hypothetical protein
MRVCIVEMQYGSSLPIFDGVCWANSVYLLKDFGARAVRIKMKCLCENLDVKQTQLGPENGEDSFRTADHLRQFRWNLGSFQDPEVFMIC